MSIADDIAALKNEEVERKKLKILSLDIETSPNLALVWGLFKENIPLDRFLEEGQVICFAAKWHGRDEIIFHSDFHDGHKEMIYRFWDLLDEADIVTTYNGNSFDLKHANREFLLLNLNPPSPYKSVDLLTVMRSNFKFASNKLQHILSALGLDEKVKHRGFQLWLDCMAGDPEAWEEMKTYNIGDISGNENLYNRVLPWIKNHPVISLIESEDELVCNRCGSTDLMEDGVEHTATLQYVRYSCNSCGGWLRENRHGKRISNVKSI